MSNKYLEKIAEAAETQKTSTGRKLARGALAAGGLVAGTALGFKKGLVLGGSSGYGIHILKKFGKGISPSTTDRGKKKLALNLLRKAQYGAGIGAGAGAVGGGLVGAKIGKAVGNIGNKGQD